MGCHMTCFACCLRVSHDMFWMSSDIYVVSRDMIWTSCDMFWMSRDIYGRLFFGHFLGIVGDWTCRNIEFLAKFGLEFP